MTISKETCGSWWSLLTEAPEADVQAAIAKTKAWLLRTGGTLLVEEAERVGHMVVLAGRSYPAGVATCVSLPVAELLSAA